MVFRKERETPMKISWKMWLLIIVLLLSLLALRPTFSKGAIIKSVDQGSIASQQGIHPGEIIKSVNGQPVQNKEDYGKIVVDLFPSEKEKKIEITTDKGDYILLTNETPQITVDNIPFTRLQTGLDLRGGARALVKPDAEITDDELRDLVDVSRNRFNVYGLSDVNIQGVSDLSGNKFLLIEVAGANPTDLEQLIGQQGKFEARVANQTVFEGGQKDISSVCRNDASCSGIVSCDQTQGGYICRFRFAVYLKESAAKRHAEVTNNLSLDDSGQYLTEKLYLLVDNNEVDSLLISSNLRGQATTQISIEGSGSGATQQEAMKDAKASMNKLQTVLITGSLPYKLSIVKLDTISPSLGKEFVFLIFLAGISAVLVVSIIIFVRYRKIKLSLALLMTSFSEIVIILGIAALIRWNLDLPSIAGILATIGTGVDQQIVIVDESVHGKTLSLKERMKRASFIIMSSYLTLVAAMIPLYWAGAGLFKGFALTTIIGATAGILITRPAFSDIVKRMSS
ncbi:MAG: PDZ domain-containing protein [Nanoarchaeota archaeon]|nr:PDZ domain-containing protein [Nanoarchaeota archaeon]